MATSTVRRIAALLGAAAAALPTAALAAPGDWLYDYDRNAPPPARVQAPPPVGGRRSSCNKVSEADGGRALSRAAP